MENSVSFLLKKPSRRGPPEIACALPSPGVAKAMAVFPMLVATMMVAPGGGGLGAPPGGGGPPDDQRPRPHYGDWDAWCQCGGCLRLVRTKSKGFQCGGSRDPWGSFLFCEKEVGTQTWNGRPVCDACHQALLAANPPVIPIPVPNPPVLPAPVLPPPVLPPPAFPKAKAKAKGKTNAKAIKKPKRK